eukprot:11645882-Ditylum_brightwellii.AAC.1
MMTGNSLLLLSCHLLHIQGIEPPPLANQYPTAIERRTHGEGVPPTSTTILRMSTEENTLNPSADSPTFSEIVEETQELLEEMAQPPPELEGPPCSPSSPTHNSPSCSYTAVQLKVLPTQIDVLTSKVIELIQAVDLL